MNDLGVFLRDHARQSTRKVVATDQGFVGQHVQFGDLFSLNVFRVGFAQHVDQAGAHHRVGDNLGRECNVVKQIGQRAGCFRVSALTF